MEDQQVTSIVPQLRNIGSAPAAVIWGMGTRDDIGAQAIYSKGASMARYGGRFDLCSNGPRREDETGRLLIFQMKERL